MVRYRTDGFCNSCYKKKSVTKGVLPVISTEFKEVSTAFVYVSFEYLRFCKEKSLYEYTKYLRSYISLCIL